MARKKGIGTKSRESARTVGGPFYHRAFKNAGHPFGHAKIARKFGSKGRKGPGMHRSMARD